MMVKEIERAGFTIVHVVNMTPVSQSIGTNRILKAYSIPAPMADYNESADVKAQQRYEMMAKALKLLNTDIQEQTVLS